jgi:acetylornithine deacetylase
MNMDEVFYNAVDLLKEMIGKPSLSREENEVADLVCHYLTTQGVTRVDDFTQF